MSEIPLDSSIPEYLIAYRSNIPRVRLGVEVGRGRRRERTRREANYRIIAFNCDCRYLRNGTVEACDCRRVPNYWMLTSSATTAAAVVAVEPRRGTALLVIAGTNYAISAAL